MNNLQSKEIEQQDRQIDVLATLKNKLEKRRDDGVADQVRTLKNARVISRKRVNVKIVIKPCFSKTIIIFKLVDAGKAVDQ